jgi:L-asparaginase
MQNILIIYTGGTIGMIQNEKGVLLPFTFENLINYIPLLKNFPAKLSSVSFDNMIDSADANPEFWIKIANVIVENYDNYDGFVVLHGSDTMSYSASALSFMLENLTKPVIFTGSQLPIGLLRTDARENIIAALEMACMSKNGKHLIQEVCIYFENKLMRGNRTTKFSAENFDAFISPNYPALAKVGTDIKIFDEYLYRPSIDFLIFHKSICTDIALVKLFPGMSLNILRNLINTPGLKGLIIESYGSGNAPTDSDFIGVLKEAIDKNIIVLNISQCLVGKVIQGKYSTSIKLQEIGVIGGKDMTTEAAVTKMMYLLGQNYKKNEIEKLLCISLRGEC